MSEALRASLRTPLRLAAFTAGTAALLAAVHLATRDPITAEQRRADREALAALLPESGYDNDPVADTILLRAPDGFGDDRPRPVRRATLHGEPAAAVLSVVAPDGYGGPIELLLGVRADGTVIAWFHDDGRFLKQGGRATGEFKLLQTESTDMGDTWS
ncbi:MAG: hypothetical protein ACK55W_06130, partial [Pseudomonadota bacterium]